MKWTVKLKDIESGHCSWYQVHARTQAVAVRFAKAKSGNPMHQELLLVVSEKERERNYKERAKVPGSLLFHLYDLEGPVLTN